jgi:hypothetical protein
MFKPSPEILILSINQVACYHNKTLTGKAPYLPSLSYKMSTSLLTFKYKYKKGGIYLDVLILMSCLICFSLVYETSNKQACVHSCIEVH